MASTTNPKSPQQNSSAAHKPAAAAGRKADSYPARALDPEPLAGLVQRAERDPASLTRPAIDRLQRAIGNRTVSRLLRPTRLVEVRAGRAQAVQPKLQVGPAGDQYEQEADRIAAQVLALPAPPAPQPAAVQRQDDEEELQMMPRLQRAAPDEDKLQSQDTRTGFEAGGAFEDRLSAQQGGGSPLPGPVRNFMEPRFGADFSGVRLHTGGEAAQLNRAIGAQAFTRGADIYLGQGKDDLASSAGRELLAHELTHTIQQGAAPLQRQPRTEVETDQIQRHSESALQAQIKAAAQEDEEQIQRHPIAAPLEMGRSASFGERKTDLMIAIVNNVGFQTQIRAGLKALVDKQLPPNQAVAKKAAIDTTLQWQLDASNSVGAPATAGADGIKVYYQNAMWYEPDGSPRAAYIKSVMIHESLHFLSANHTGFQTLDLENLNAHAKGGTAISHSLDEAVTERLSREVAGNVMGVNEAYTTNYWNIEARRGLDFHLTSKGLNLLATGASQLWLGDMVDIVLDQTKLTWEELKTAYLSEDPALAPDKKKIKDVVTAKKADIAAAWKAESERALRRQLGSEALTADRWKDYLDLCVGIVNRRAAREIRHTGQRAQRTGPEIEAAINAELKDLPGRHVVVAKHDARSSESIDDWQVIRAQTPDIDPPAGLAKDAAWGESQRQAQWGVSNPADVPNVKGKAAGTDPNAEDRMRQIRGTPGKNFRPAMFGNPEQPAVPGVPGDISIPIGVLEGYIAQATALLNMQNTLIQHPMGWVIVPWEASPRQDEWALKANAPFRDYGPDASRHALGKNLDKSLTSLSGAPPTASARAYVMGMGGGGYEANGELGILNIEHVNLATVVHEMGHHKQNVEQGYNEKTIQQVPAIRFLLDFHNILVNENQLAKKALRDDPHSDPFVRLRYTEEPVRRTISEWLALAQSQAAESGNYQRFKARLATLNVRGGKLVEILNDIERALADNPDLYPGNVPNLFKNMMVDEIIIKNEDKGDFMLRMEPEAERVNPKKA